MLAITIDGYSLGALIVLATGGIIVTVIIARLIKREQDVRLTKVGVFLERERYGEQGDIWTPDPFADSRDQETKPIPPPTPPPPPPGEKTWPQREEEP